MSKVGRPTRFRKTEPVAFWQQEAERTVRKGPRKKAPRRKMKVNKNGGRARKSGKAKLNVRKGRSRSCRRTSSGMMIARRLAAMLRAFAKLKDPRVNRTRRHQMVDIIVIAVCAVICGAQDWKGIARWGRLQEEFLGQFLELPNGIPSRDTFRRIICRLDPDEFQNCFLEWTSTLAGNKKGRILNIDGKTLRRSGRRQSDNPLHIVSVWACERSVTLGQTTVDAKSNEITAIPKLLEMLDIEGAIVTIDAMGCQKAIARKIKSGGADYCLAVKGNQEHLYKDIVNHFDDCFATGFANTESASHQTCERGHGRDETRDYILTPVPGTLRHAEAWAGMTAVGMVISRRTVNGEERSEARYYIVSIPYRHIHRFASAVRGHWGIENSLHWIMDVTFREDDSRIQNEIGASNFSWLRRFAISLLKNEPTLKDSIKGKREEAMWNTDYLLKVLLAAIPSNRN